MWFRLKDGLSRLHIQRWTQQSLPCIFLVCCTYLLWSINQGWLKLHFPHQHQASCERQTSLSVRENSSISTQDRHLPRQLTWHKHLSEVVWESSKELSNPRKGCRFRAKSLDEKKAFLCENGICHRCCASISYLAEECQIPMKCSDFESHCHIKDMHPGPACQ